MKKVYFENILFALSAPILILVFGFYGVIKVLCKYEDRDNLYFENILLALFVIISAPILILVFGFYGVIKACKHEDRDNLCD